MTELESIEKAGTAWCGEKTLNKDMDPELAFEFARILKRECDKAAQRQDISVREAITALKGAMKADYSYAYAWYCNLVCAATDEGVGRETASKAAARFMSLAFDLTAVEPKSEESDEAESEPTWRDRPALL